MAPTPKHDPAVSFWQRNYVRFATPVASWIGDESTRHYYRAFWACSIGGALEVIGWLLLIAGDHGPVAVAGAAMVVAGVAVLALMVVEFVAMTRAATRHLGVCFRYRDLSALRADKFPAWLEAQKDRHRST